MSSLQSSLSSFDAHFTFFTSYYSLACKKNMHFVKFRLKHSCNNLLFNMLDLTLTKHGRSTSQIPDSITV